VDVLDNPVWSALTGPQRDYAEVVGDIARYQPEVSLFGAFARLPGPRHWTAMAELIGAGGVVITTGPTGPPPDGWRVEYDGEGVQMTGEGVDVARQLDVPEGADIVRLGADDVADMLELVALTRPGPFEPATWELGGYVGIRRDGRLVAMAGERMRPVGWAEISAVATHPDHRRQGLGELLVRVVAAGIRERDELPLLHVAATNTSAIRLYEAMGFAARGTVRFLSVRAPGEPQQGGPDPVMPHG